METKEKESEPKTHSLLKMFIFVVGAVVIAVILGRALVTTANILKPEQPKSNFQYCYERCIGMGMYPHQTCEELDCDKNGCPSVTHYSNVEGFEFCYYNQGYCLSTMCSGVK